MTQDYADLEKRLREMVSAWKRWGADGIYMGKLHSDIVSEAADAIRSLTTSLSRVEGERDALESLCDAFARNFQQREYPCSPHCAGYLRERAASLGVGLSRASADQTDGGEGQ